MDGKVGVSNLEGKVKIEITKPEFNTMKKINIEVSKTNYIDNSLEVEVPFTKPKKTVELKDLKIENKDEGNVTLSFNTNPGASYTVDGKTGTAGESGLVKVTLEKLEYGENPRMIVVEVTKENYLSNSQEIELKETKGQKTTKIENVDWKDKDDDFATLSFETDSDASWQVDGHSGTAPADGKVKIDIEKPEYGE